LKQIGLGLHNYHDTAKSFPPTVVLTGNPYEPTQSNPSTLPHHYTWLFMTLPFMEQTPLYEQTNKIVPVWLGGPPVGSPQPVVSTSVPGLHCPSSKELSIGPETRNMEYTNYAGSEGYHWWTSAMIGATWANGVMQTDHTADFSGVFTITKTRRMADLTDGTSNVVACAEVNSTGYKGGPIRTCGTGIPRFSNNEQVFRAAFVWTGVYGWCCERGVYLNPDGSGPVAAARWFPGGSPHPFSPTFLSAWGPNANWPGASSLHPGGLNVLLADGSARYVAETIPWDIWAKINGIEDANPVSDY
jgi:prepilin-type processing-associated H-X9-DG protein